MALLIVFGILVVIAVAVKLIAGKVSTMVGEDQSKERRRLGKITLLIFVVYIGSMFLYKAIVG